VRFLALFASEGNLGPKYRDFLKVEKTHLSQKTAKNEQIVKLGFYGNFREFSAFFCMIENIFLTLYPKQRIM
jgi:hypothetical protein